jgi:hypothetical protein
MEFGSFYQRIANCTRTEPSRRQPVMEVRTVTMVRSSRPATDPYVAHLDGAVHCQHAGADDVHAAWNQDELYDLGSVADQVCTVACLTESPSTIGVSRCQPRTIASHVYWARHDGCRSGEPHRCRSYGVIGL